MKLLVFLYTFVALASAESNIIEAVPYNLAKETGRKFDPRISNGHPAVANQFPYQVSVVTPTGVNVYYICAGSLISSSWVLTAAHCIQGTQVILRFGSLKIFSGGISQTSFQLIVHPEYNQLGKDVALVRLPSPFALSNAIQPIRLPTAAQNGFTFVGVQSTLSGWGSQAPGEAEDDSLRWVSMRIISNADCADVYGPNMLVNHIVCARGFYNPGNQGQCNGDSGGPLTINEGGVYNTLIGVISFSAINGCGSGNPSGSMRVSAFTSWIASVTFIHVRLQLCVYILVSRFISMSSIIDGYILV